MGLITTGFISVKLPIASDCRTASNTRKLSLSTPGPPISGHSRVARPIIWSYRMRLLTRRMKARLTIFGTSMPVVSRIHGDGNLRCWVVAGSAGSWRRACRYYQ